MPRIVLESFSVVAPPGWVDITASVEADNAPFTLAREDGVGALQFSVALYAVGPVPDPTPDDLSEMMADFATKRGLNSPREVNLGSGPLRLAAGSFEFGEDFLKVWQFSDGRSFGFVTYVCKSGREHAELGECESIVRSVRFR